MSLLARNGTTLLDQLSAASLPPLSRLCHHCEVIIEQLNMANSARMTICYGQPAGELGGQESGWAGCTAAVVVVGGFHFHTHAQSLPPLCQALIIQNSGCLAVAVVFGPLGHGSSGHSRWSGADSSQAHPIFTPSAIAATAPMPRS